MHTVNLVCPTHAVSQIFHKSLGHTPGPIFWVDWKHGPMASLSSVLLTMLMIVSNKGHQAGQNKQRRMAHLIADPCSHPAKGGGQAQPQALQAYGGIDRRLALYWRHNSSIAGAVGCRVADDAVQQDQVICRPGHAPHRVLQDRYRIQPRPDQILRQAGTGSAEPV